MSQHDDFDRSLARWFEAEARPAATADVLDRALHATGQRRPRPRLFAAVGSHWVGGGSGSISGVARGRRTGMRGSIALALLLLVLVLALVAGAVLVGARLLQRDPAVAQLVLNVQTGSPGTVADFVEVALYADGRVIWGPDERGGYLEQRLTPEGLERLRSRALSTGLFDHDLFATSIGTDVVGSGYIKVLRGDRPVIVAWGTGVDVSGDRLEGNFVRASSAQAAEVSELDNFLRDPTTWGFADDMYIQSEITPFVPTHLWVSYDRGRPDWSQLPSPAPEIVTRIIGPGFMDGCSNISLDQAREIAQVLAQAGIRTDYDDRFGLTFSLPSSFVHAHPALPHDVGIVCGDV